MTTRKKVTVADVRQARSEGRQLTMVTAYDWGFGRLLDEAGIDIIIVGDSLGMNMLGYASTIPVSLEEMIHHTRAVARGVKFGLVLGDLPFLTYEICCEDAIRSAGRLIKDGNADAVKIEGGTEFASVVKALVRAKIPVMGHLGVLPQSTLVRSGFKKVPGKTRAEIQNLIDDAKALEEAGAFAILLEAVPTEVSRHLRERVSIPIIGLGSGPHLDGQGLVHTDLLGLPTPLERKPRFTKQYASLSSIAVDALSRFVNETQTHVFPADDHVYHLPEDQVADLLRDI